MLNKINQYFLVFSIIFHLSVYADKTQAEVTSIGFLSLQGEATIPLSLLDPDIDDFGRPGALLAMKENQTTGRFIGQEFDIHESIVSSEEELDSAYESLLQQGIRLIVADLPKNVLLRVSTRSASDGTLIFNTRSTDDELRNEACSAQLLHVIPSRAMLADALAQYLVWKRWNKWALVIGKHENDKAFGEAIRRSAKRFGGEIVEEAEWTFDAGARRTDSGHVTAQQEIPSATQLKDHDVLIVADESDEFGEYLPYRTYSPRPVVGTQGLVPTAWHRSHEQWGGTQLQRRFFRQAKRDMTVRDYTAWVAIRAIGEAAVQTRSNDINVIREFLLNDQFKLAAFKGVPLQFRNWNGQLKQPILLAAPRMLVSVSPQNGFLHEFSALDTLGYDRPETKCNSFN